MGAAEDFRAFWTMNVELAGGTVEKGVMRCPFPGMPVNGVLELHDQDPEAIRAEFVERGTPWTWYCWNDEDVPGLVPMDGFDLVEHPMMKTRPDPMVDRIGPEDTEAWIDVMMEAFAIPADQRGYFSDLQRRFMAHPDVQCFGLKRKGKLVATTSLFTGAGNAGIYQTAVLPQYRRGGLAGRVVQSAIAAAQDKPLIVGCTTQDGRALSEALGAEVVGHVKQFVWFP